MIVLSTEDGLPANAYRPITQCSRKKTATLFFGHNFCEYKPIFKILSPMIPKKTVWVAVIVVSTSPQLCWYTTLWNSKIHNNRQTITRTGKINTFYTQQS